MGKIMTYILTAIMMAAGGFSVTASSFTTMSLSEVSALLDTAPAEGVSFGDPSATEGTLSGAVTRGPVCVEVNADDLITKVYGSLDSCANRAQCLAAAGRRLAMTPRQEENSLWLDSEDGYQLSYYGMIPQLSAMARFDNDDDLAEYCYFFQFPYSAESKESANSEQADFSGALLQELYDLQMPLGRNTMTDDLFQVFGDYKGNLVDVRLLDDDTSGDGRYILMFIVTPDSFTPDDDVAAM